MADLPTLASPAQLLDILEKAGSSGAEPPLEELLESVQRAKAGGAPPPAADQLEVFPEPGFVIKTANEQGQKVFINVCGSSKLPLPGGWQNGQVPAEVKRHLEQEQGGDAPQAMRFPLSMGPPRLDTDHRGEHCLVLDCIFNSEVLQQCTQYRPLKLFVIQLALGTAEQKAGLELNPQYKLPKMRCKGGTPPPQFIRVEGSATGSASSSQDQRGPDGRPLIAEVVPEGEEEPAFALLATKRKQRQREAQQAQQQQSQHAAQQAQQQQSQPQQAGAPGSSGAAGGAAAQQAGASPAAEPAMPRRLQQQQAQPPVGHQLQAQVEYCGKPATAVRITVALPAAAAAAAQHDSASVCSSVCGETVRVQALACQALEVQLPFAVSAAGSSAELTQAAGGGGDCSTQLVLTLPYRPFGSVLEELRRAKAAGAAEGAGGSSRSSSGGLADLD